MQDKTVRKIVYASMMVTGVCLMATSILRLVKSCNNDEETPETKSQVIAEQAYVVEDDVLHTGSIIKTSSGDYILKFNCGETLQTIQFKAYSIEPPEEKYDHKCEKCFAHEIERNL